MVYGGELSGENRGGVRKTEWVKIRVQWEWACYLLPSFRSVDKAFGVLRVFAWYDWTGYLWIFRKTYGVLLDPGGYWERFLIGSMVGALKR